MDFPDQPQCTNSEILSLLDLTSMCLLRRQISETYTLFTLRVQVFSDHVSISQQVYAILYDFSGHKPDLEGKIQICFRYGFSRPVPVYKH